MNVNVNVPVHCEGKKWLSMRCEVCSMGCPAWFDGSWMRGKELSKVRTEIEFTFNLLEQARRFATRYEKTLRN